MEWKYITTLKDEEVFNEIGKEIGVEVPNDFIGFIKKYNAGTPNKYHILINKTERILGAVLSYNKNEPDVDSAFLAIDVMKGKKVLPFAIDPYGNYFCYDSGKVTFWKHEENVFEVTELSLDEFIAALY